MNSRIAKKNTVTLAPRSVPGWMATLGDLMTNLLTFFVLMVSLNTASAPQDVVSRINSIRSKFGGNRLTEVESTKIFSSRLGTKVVEMDTKSADTLEKLTHLMNALSLGMDGGVYKKGDDISVVFPLDKVFVRKTWKLKKEIIPTLREIRSLIEKGGLLIRIECYWDSPMSPALAIQSSSVFTAKLAADILRFFLKDSKIHPSKFSIVGYGNKKSYHKFNVSSGRSRKLVILMKNPDLQPEKVSEYGIFNID